MTCRKQGRLHDNLLVGWHLLKKKQMEVDTKILPAVQKKTKGKEEETEDAKERERRKDEKREIHNEKKKQTKFIGHFVVHFVLLSEFSSFPSVLLSTFLFLLSFQPLLQNQRRSRKCCPPIELQNCPPLSSAKKFNHTHPSSRPVPDRKPTGKTQQSRPKETKQNRWMDRNASAEAKKMQAI